MRVIMGLFVGLLLLPVAFMLALICNVTWVVARTYATYTTMTLGTIVVISWSIRELFKGGK